MSDADDREAAAPQAKRGRVRRATPRSVNFRLGRRQVTQIGGQPASWREAYHVILSLDWIRFLGLVSVLFLAVNVIFATAYWIVPGSITNARPESLADAFFFSVETVSTVGYGDMFPHGVYGHIIASLETFVGLISTALATGVAFVRFSRPRARIMFAEHPVVAPFNAVPTLMIRVANERHNRLLAASVRVTLNRSETTLEGTHFRRLIDLKLARDQNPTFALTWTIMHPIDAASPFHGHTAKDLHDSDDILVVAIAATDDILNDDVHARHEYSLNRIRFDHRYADVIAVEGDRLTVDLTRFHDVHPIAAAGEDGTG